MKKSKHVLLIIIGAISAIVFAIIATTIFASYDTSTDHILTSRVRYLFALVFIVGVFGIVTSLILKKWREKMQPQTNATSNQRSGRGTLAAWAIIIFLVVIISASALWYYQPWNSALQPGLTCTNGAGEEQEFHEEDLDESRFLVEVPTTPEGKGCWALVATPDWWKNHWSFQQTDNHRDMKFYFMAPGGKPIGPFGWDNKPPDLGMPPTFFVQATKPGGKLKFWTSALPPVSDKE